MGKSKEGRVTASTFHDVKTKMDKLHKGLATSMNNVIEKVCGYTSTPDLPALKYGRNMESEAREVYLKFHKQQCGRNVTAKECSLFIDKKNRFIGASPDGVIQCNKCGEGLLEIKCPITACGVVPTAETVKYLKKYGEVVMLNKSHRYYTQIQGQLGVTGKNWCDLFVYSRLGFHVERVLIDTSMWQLCLQNIQEFYTSCILKELMEQTVLESYCSKTEGSR